jgi:excisionase family DNA binding protein
VESHERLRGRLAWLQVLLCADARREVSWDSTDWFGVQGGKRIEGGFEMSLEPVGAGTRQEVPLWMADEVATYLRVSRSWVYQHAEAGTLPVIRLPGSSLLRFDPEEIRAYARGEWRPPKVTQLRPLALRTT